MVQSKSTNEHEKSLLRGFFCHHGNRTTAFNKYEKMFVVLQTLKAYLHADKISKLCCYNCSKYGTSKLKLSF